MTHHTAKANLEKRSAWPPEAILYGLPHIWGLVQDGLNPSGPDLGPNPRYPQVLKPRSHPIIDLGPMLSTYCVQEESISCEVIAIARTKFLDGLMVTRCCPK